MKNYLMSILLMSSLIAGLQADETDMNRQKQKITHGFFDLHNVLVTRSPKTFITGGLYNLFGSEKTLAGKAHLGLQFTTALLDPRVYKNIYSLVGNKTKHQITESYFNVIGKLGYTKLQKSLIQFANNIFVVNPKIIPILILLKKEGVQLHLFSNAGKQIVQDFHDRNLFPELFGKDGFFSENNTINNKVPESGVYPIQKPLPQAFTTALASVEGATPENSFMVDDKAKNLPDARGNEIRTEKYDFAPITPWAATVCYNKKNHAAFEKQIKALV